MAEKTFTVSAESSVQPVHHQLALVARSARLEEESSVLDPHEGQEVMVQDSCIVLTAHVCVLGRK
jgi:hypothetical protein